ncbi:monocarboxylate transporter 12-B-like isoform X2 [Patiria miniata]|uniref:Uncharacterized protein n=1 Tax=Patiria miniata TaxID=46514 RepID=A0A914A2C7_PATMI|nr:monocarboxylate transporter 12-B-like isoform X2 [Patiria miniata]
MTEKFYNRLPVVEDRGANNNTADGGQTIATNAEQRKRWREVCSKIRRPGWKWVVLLGAFLLRAVFSGFIANYTTLSVKLREFYGTNEEILGWIGSLIFCSRSMCSPLTAAFAVKIGYRSAIFLGVLCSATSLMVSSFVPGIHWYFLTLSVLLGAGISLACFSSYDYLMSYFHKTFVRAAGFMAIASSAGLMICAPAMEALLESIGLHNTLRVFAGIFLLSALSAFTIRPSPAEKRRMSVIQVPLATRNPDSPTPAEPIVPIKPPVHAKKTFRESMAVFSSLLRSADMWILGVMGLTLCLASSFTYLYMVVLGLCRAIYNLMVFPSVIECMGKQRKLECCSISSMMCGIGYLPGGVIGGALFDATGSYLYSLLVCVALYLTSSLLLVWCAYRFRRARRTQGEMIDQSAESKGKGDKGSEVEQNQEVYVVETIMTTV